MAADPKNGLVLEAIDIYTAPLGTALPADVTAPFAAGWLQCGLIDPDDGIEHTRDWGKDDDFYGMGPDGVVHVANVKGQFKTTEVFNFIEDNAATREILWPGSTETELVVPKSVPLLFAQERHFQNGTVERLITKRYAQIDVAGWTINQDLTKFPATATIFPDGTGSLWTRQVEVAP